MLNQKIENLLNLALDATVEEREKSLNLNVGYEEKEKEWELIIKYSGNPSQIEEVAEQVTYLFDQYAIVVVKENQIQRLSELVGVEYIEKPKRLFFEVINGKRVSCVNEVQNQKLSLFGKGILIAIIDSGINYTLREFQNNDGTTRIRAIWDQSLMPRLGERSPEGYSRGVEYQQNEINQELQGEREGVVRTRDLTGHGTAVAAIAAGGSGVVGVAPESELLIVKMSNAIEGGFPRTTELMLGIDYVVKKALEYQMPVAINISFGNTYGPHDGSTLLERFIDDISGIGRNVFCIGMGNEASSAGHTSGVLVEQEMSEVELAVQELQTTLNLQIWKNYVDEFTVSIVSPSGEVIGPISQKYEAQRFRLGETELLIYYGMPSPYSAAQEIYIDFLPVSEYVNSGIWRIFLTPEKIIDGRFDMWLPSEGTLNVGTSFLNPGSNLSLTIPSTSGRAVSVGAYDASTFAYAQFSGRGYVSERGFSKPDIVAPGVNVITAAVGGGTVMVSGTSFAAPFATGAAALLMEWGITRGNDPYLYGEKVKAYFRRGAKALPGFEVYPNPQVGYGALCVRDSLPI